MSKLLTTVETADRLGKSARAVIRMVERHELEPARKLPGLRGAYLFDADTVEALAAARKTVA